MKYILICLLSICTFSNLLAQENNLKVLTYNIWNGYDWGKDEDRRSRVNTWIKEQNPSIVAVQELCKYTPEKLQEDANTWGHKYSVLLKTTGYSVGLTSAHPIELKEKIMEGMHHGALHCKTNGIDVFVIHFSPSSYLKRREEAAIILEKLDAVRKQNDMYLVAGDFNAHSPMDADLYDSNGALITRLRASNADNPIKGNLADGNLDYAVISSLLAFPLIDVSQHYTKGMNERGSFPGQILGPVNGETEQELIDRMQRIDFILVSPALGRNCISAKVHNQKDNHFLSDHYPVTAEFE